MTVSKRKKQDKERGGVSTVAAAVAGVVVGAGVAVAGAIALSNVLGCCRRRFLCFPVVPYFL